MTTSTHVDANVGADEREAKRRKTDPDTPNFGAVGETPDSGAAAGSGSAGSAMADTPADEVVIGSRKSQLALWQTNHIVDLLKKEYGCRSFRIMTESTLGDNVLNRHLADLGREHVANSKQDAAAAAASDGKPKSAAEAAVAASGLFTKELEVQLLNKQTHLAVHSLKDMPTRLPTGLTLACITKRAQVPNDCAVLHPRYGGPLGVSEVAKNAGNQGLSRIVKNWQELSDVVGDFSLGVDRESRQSTPDANSVSDAGDSTGGSAIGFGGFVEIALATARSKFKLLGGSGGKDGSKPTVTLVVGSSSLRRESLMRHAMLEEAAVQAAAHEEFKLELQIENIRGNVQTRLRKLDAAGPLGSEGGSRKRKADEAAGSTDTVDTPAYDMILLAAVGLQRCELENRIDYVLDEISFPYAVSQGALGVECRSDDADTLQLFWTPQISNEPTTLRCLAERSLLAALDGGCQISMGVRSFCDEGTTAGKDPNLILNLGSGADASATAFDLSLSAIVMTREGDPKTAVKARAMVTLTCVRSAEEERQNKPSLDDLRLRRESVAKALGIAVGRKLMGTCWNRALATLPSTADEKATEEHCMKDMRCLGLGGDNVGQSIGVEDFIGYKSGGVNASSDLQLVKTILKELESGKSMAGVVLRPITYGSAETAGILTEGF